MSEEELKRGKGRYGGIGGKKREKNPRDKRGRVKSEVE